VNSPNSDHWIARHSRPVIFLIVTLALLGAYLPFTIPVSVFPSTNFPRVLSAVDNGVMVLSGLAVVPRGTGWLTRLDADGNVVWEKFGDQYGYQDAMPADNGGLYIIRGNEVVKIDAEGDLLAQHDLPGSEQTFLHPPGLPTKVQIAAILSTQKSVIIDIDLNLKGPLHTTHIGDIGTNRGLYTGNGVATLFGSRHLGYFNQPTAGAAPVEDVPGQGE